MLPGVIKQNIFRFGIISYSITDAVIDIIHQVAFRNIDYFIKNSGNMKANCVGGNKLRLFSGVIFFGGRLGQKLFIARRKFQFIPVLPGLRGSYYGHHQEPIQFSNTP